MICQSGSATRSLLPGKKNDIAISGGQILGDEYSDHVMKVLYRRVLLITYNNLISTFQQNRSGIILRERSVENVRTPQFECS